jgi:hypothetical protein
MRAGTAFLLTFVLLCGAAIGADALITAAAEDRASEEVTRRLEAPTQVRMRGWPVTVHLLQGRIPELELTASGVPIEGQEQRIDRLRVTLSDARVRFRGLQTAPELEAGTGTFDAELSETAVTALAGFPGTVVLGDGIASVAAAGQTFDVAVTTEQGAVVFRPLVPVAQGLQPVELRLPDLPWAMVQVDRALISPGLLRLSGLVVLRRE